MDAQDGKWNRIRRYHTCDDKLYAKTLNSVYLQYDSIVYISNDKCFSKIQNLEFPNKQYIQDEIIKIEKMVIM